MNDIESQGLEAQIRVRAYHLWEAEGRPDGRAEEFWRIAQAEINAPVKAVKRRAKAAEKTEEKPASASVPAKAVKPRKPAGPKAAPAAEKKPSRSKAKLEAES
jgi:hypothetical protein